MGFRTKMNKIKVKEEKPNFRDRITNEINVEFEEAKKQVKKIASFRLNQIKIDNQLWKFLTASCISMKK